MINLSSYLSAVQILLYSFDLNPCRDCFHFVTDAIQI